MTRTVDKPSCEESAMLYRPWSLVLSHAKQCSQQRIEMWQCPALFLRWVTCNDSVDNRLDSSARLETGKRGRKADQQPVWKAMLYGCFSLFIWSLQDLRLEPWVMHVWRSNVVHHENQMVSRTDNDEIIHRSRAKSGVSIDESAGIHSNMKTGCCFSVK